MVIGERVLKTASDLLHGHLLAYRRQIEEAYVEMGDSLTIKLSVKSSPGSHGTTIDTAIGFVTGQVKDTSTSVVDENQLELQFGGDHAND